MVTADLFKFVVFLEVGRGMDGGDGGDGGSGYKVGCLFFCWCHEGR